VFRSADGGANWQATSVGLINTDIQALLLDERDGILYAGTEGGGFRSTEGGARWRATSVGLTDIDVPALVLDKRDGTLYVGTWGDGVFHSTDDGASWQEASAGLTSTDMRALMLDERDGTLYAGTWGDGVFRSTDGGASWQEASAGLIDTRIWALTLDERDGALYAGTQGAGVFRSTNSGVNWHAANVGLDDTFVPALVLDRRDGTLYAGTRGGGVFRSADGGANWQATSVGLINTDMQALLLDERDGILYAGTGGGVFRSTDGGASWQAASAGLSDVKLQALTLDARDGTMYAGTEGGVFRSTDNGASWQAASAGLTDSNVRALTSDERDGTLYAGTRNAGVFRSADDGVSWQLLPAALLRYGLPDLLSAQHSYGVASYGPGEAPVWATFGGGASWVRLVAGLGLQQAAIRPLPGGQAEVLAAWGATLARAELEPGYRRTPLLWFALRALVWKATTWAVAGSGWLGAALILVVALALVFTNANLARPFGLPLWATLLARRRLDVYADPERLDTAWPDWEQVVRAELLRHGDATKDDLLRVPRPFRRYALRRYARTYAPVQMLEAQPGRLRLLTGDRLRRWQTAWGAAGRALGTRSGLTSAGRAGVDDLAAVLAETLGLTLGPARDFEAVRAYLAEAPALRLNLPPRFPLVFLAEPQPSARSVEMLVDAIDVLRETEYFALVVPLEPTIRQLDTAAELRQAIDNSPHVHDFIVLGGDEALDVLIARQPTQALVQQILTQIDLTIVSPFVVSGPVPERMFFGREGETKTLVEGADSADFAVVGNRKIGKTSLLQQSRARLAAGKRVRPLLVDCQTVRDATGFFAAFQAQTRLDLPSDTPEGFSAALTELHQEGALVLLLDEVDALLAAEMTQGERLAATWRALAQAGVCHFVFCGSTGLARRLDDPHSVFFNFPQPLPLGYLAPETARLVLTQPLETLGIIMEDEEALLGEVLALTSGHPNFIQYLGRGLVEAANRRKERRIMLADLDTLRDSTEFIEYYLKTVWGEAGPLEKLITLVAPPDGFQLGSLETALAARDVSVSEQALDAALKLLRIYSLLEKRGRTYSFVPRAFPDILHGTQEVDRLIALEKRHLEAGGI
jgi:ligand-binding sensor domain-containing protein